MARRKLASGPLATPQHILGSQSLPRSSDERFAPSKDSSACVEPRKASPVSRFKLVEGRHRRKFALSDGGLPEVRFQSYLAPCYH